MNFKPVILSGKVNADGRTNIKIYFSHRGVRKELPTNYYVYPKEFTKNRVNKKHPNADFINVELRKLVLQYEMKVLGVNLDNWTPDQLVKFLKSDQERPDDFFPYFDNFISEKSTLNQRTGQLYQATINKIKTFDSNPDLRFADINTGWLKKFEIFMIREGLKQNSISIHFRNIRTVIYNAIDNEFIPATVNPFRRFKIKQGESGKKALTIEQIKKIRDYQTEFTGMAKVRDGFMLSFYLIGINNSDMYNLQGVTDENRLDYQRNKTHKDYSILVQPEAAEIISRYPGKKRLLCYADEHLSPVRMTSYFNQVLKEIGEATGIDGLTMYHARHTWATLAANHLNASNEDIGAALGHSNKTVTTIYIKRDPERVDKLNREVLNLLIN